MKMNLFLTIGTFSTTVPAIVAAIFGMNLQSRLEHHPVAFYVVSSCIILGNATLFTMAVLYARRKRIW